MNLPSISGMIIIFTFPTNIRQALKDFNNLVIFHSVPCSMDDTYSVLSQKHFPEHLIANGGYSVSMTKGFHFDQYQKEIPKPTACVPQYVNIVHAVGEELLLFYKFLSFCSSYDSLIAWQSAPLNFGSG